MRSTLSEPHLRHAGQAHEWPMLNVSESILRLDAVLSRTGLSRSSLYQLIAHEKFPKPIHLGSRSVGWVESEITSWINGRIHVSRGH